MTYGLLNYTIFNEIIVKNKLVPSHRHKYLHLSHANSEVRLIEFVGNVPAEWTKLATLLNKRMEEAKAKQHLFPSLFLLCMINRKTGVKEYAMFSRRVTSHELPLG